MRLNKIHKQWHQLHEQLKPDALRLYAEGFGAKSIAKRIGTTHKVVIKILKNAGVYKPFTLKPPKGKGKYLKEKREREASEMKRRSVKCLSKKQPKTRGLKFKTNAEYVKWRYHNDYAYRVYQLLRQRMKKVIHRGVKSGRSMEMVGCTTEEARKYIESKWKKGMSWQNSGTGPGKWHIDHITPCSAFDLTKPDQQKICFHYTNLQPLWSRQNIKKSDKINHLNCQLRMPI